MNHPPVTLIDATAVLKELDSRSLLYAQIAASDRDNEDTTGASYHQGIADGIAFAIGTITIAKADAYCDAVKEGARSNEALKHQ